MLGLFIKILIPALIFYFVFKKVRVLLFGELPARGQGNPGGQSKHVNNNSNDGNPAGSEEVVDLCEVCGNMLNAKGKCTQPSCANS